MRADPKSVTFQLSHQYLFTLLGSAHVKTAQKTLMKLTPGDCMKKSLVKLIGHALSLSYFSTNLMDFSVPLNDEHFVFYAYY